MGIPERRAKEKEEIKKLILEAARKLFISEGVENTTIRKIAQKIEYSVGTVYVYYKDKNDILHDLHTQGFQQLGNDMRVLSKVANPMERLKALGRVYLQFAMENPDMYDLMFTLKAPIEFLEHHKDQCWNEGSRTFDVLKSTVAQCIDNGYLKGHQLEPVSFAIWSGVHGMISLYLSQRLKGVMQGDPETVVLAAYEEFVLMLDK